MNDQTTAVQASILADLDGFQESVASIEKAEVRKVAPAKKEVFSNRDSIQTFSNLQALITAHEKNLFGGGALITNKQGTVYMAMAVDKVWNTYPHLMADRRTGCVKSFSVLKFPVTVEA